MDYEPFDSSGTDDDLPPSHQNRISRGGGGRVAGNGRPAVVASVPYNSRMYDNKDADMETQIHLLEQEAYISVLRAFKAQADAISWEKESLITELRKELRLSNEEHREILSRVKADDLIRRIREWRQTTGLQAGQVAAAQEPIPAPTISAPRKKQKMTQAMTSQTFGDPNPSFHPPTFAPPNPPPSSGSRGGGPLVGPKSKKHKPFPPSNPSGRGQTAANRVDSTTLVAERAESTKFDALIGRKVRTRWPDDNNFYKAVITDYNPAEGRHALVYDIHTPNETWEWVNLSEISPEDIQWEGDDPRISYQQGCYGGLGSARNRASGPDGLPSGGGRGRGMNKGHFKKDFPQQNGIGKKAPDNIQILHTDTLIKEVERVFGSTNPDPSELEKAKKLLKEQEQSLVDAIQRLVDISEDG